MKKVLMAVAALSLAALGGCAQIDSFTQKLDYATGTAVSEQQMSAFVKGKTSKDNVAATIGHPPQKSMMGETEVWTYPYTLIPANPLKPNVFSNTVFEFNKRGVLINSYKTGGTPGQSGNPLLNAAGM
jgi:outer membrane protein assembly factor BamE (lipoprotein component of BamABCDE complex)